MIEVSALRNRLVYEIQNSVGHILSMRALMGYAALNERRKQELDNAFSPDEKVNTPHGHLLTLRAKLLGALVSRADGRPLNT